MYSDNCNRILEHTSALTSGEYNFICVEAHPVLRDDITVEGEGEHVFPSDVVQYVSWMYTQQHMMTSHTCSLLILELIIVIGFLESFSPLEVQKWQEK